MRGVVVVAGLLVLLGVGTPSRAQEGPPPVETVVRYYEDENPHLLGYWLFTWNVCFERFVTLNPDIEFDDIPYGTRVLLPKDEPCYDFAVGRQFQRGNPPRLKYYENGQWLTEPYYSTDIEYVYTFPNLLIEDILRKYEICQDELYAHNYGLRTFGQRYLNVQWIAADVFIPRDMQPCLPDPIPPTTPPPTRTVTIRSWDLLPVEFTRTYNICPEEMMGQQWKLYTSTLGSNDFIDVLLPADRPQCYNETGKRLIYYDETGNRLDTPDYTDLEIYLASPNETLAEIAAKTGACPVDLLKINNFPDLPIDRGEIELFIPQQRACPDVEAQLIDETRYGLISTTAISLNVCPEDLFSLNSHLSWERQVQYLQPRAYSSHHTSRWMILPSEDEPCFREYHPREGQSVFDLEQELNICFQEFMGDRGFIVRLPIYNSNLIVWIRRDASPCYDSQGRRLMYAPDGEQVPLFRRDYPYDKTFKQDAKYVDLTVHTFQASDSLYSVSRQYNVCVHDLLAFNAGLITAMSEGYPTFIPNTRPCYDKATGMPLIYEDENGVPLDEPRVGDQLIYYGTQGFSRISYYYNVCENRIRDANAAKLAGEAHYLGWTIPHDRPPCYDEDGYVIDVAMQRHVANGGIVHTVQFAETLSEIAEQYDKSIYWIADANDLNSVDMIWTEQKLIIPGGVTTRDVKLISAALIALAAVGAVVMWRKR